MATRAFTLAAVRVVLVLGQVNVRYADGVREGYRSIGRSCERAALIGVRSVRLSSRHAPALAVHLRPFIFEFRTIKYYFIAIQMLLACIFISGVKNA